LLKWSVRGPVPGQATRDNAKGRASIEKQFSTYKGAFPPTGASATAGASLRPADAEIVKARRRNYEFGSPGAEDDGICIG
jgi:hypothetical protein